jgi:membrane glycosyltransferase
MSEVLVPAGRLSGRRSEAPIWRRRLLVFALNGGTWLALGAVMARMLGYAGWSWPEVAILVLFLAGLPWTLMGFWNAVIGFAILRLARDPARYTNPALAATPMDSRITSRTAICVALRHEDVERVFARLEAMAAGIEATAWSGSFCFHVLSDSSRPEVCTAEEKAFAAIRQRHPRPGFLVYRRRPANTGFKAGNIREFAERTRGQCDHMLVLDADSLMSAAAIIRLVRVMQANPRLGILQTLVVGRPSDSAFTRIFQFGMRHGMRTHTVGIAWWQGPSGPYWGHNAIIRLDPFVERCRLPMLAGRPPLGGHVLSHDQVEAALMVSAGYEVRVIADEFESWEENPPSLPDFIKRDLRWCQGNMQYFRLVARPGFTAMGRFQLTSAIMMYLGAPFWVLMLAAGLAWALLGSSNAGSTVILAPTALAPTALGFALYFGMLGIGFAPRLLGVLDVLLQPAERKRYGGGLRLLAGTLVDMLFWILLGPLMMIAQALFVAGLIFGRRVAWEAQNRKGRRLPVGEAARGLLPQMLFGAFFAAGLALLAPGAIPWAAPTLAACALAVPFACLTADGGLGRWMVRHRLCAVPDE